MQLIEHWGLNLRKFVSFHVTAENSFLELVFKFNHKSSRLFINTEIMFRHIGSKWDCLILTKKKKFI